MNDNITLPREVVELLRRQHEENEKLQEELAEANAVRERCNERAFRLESENERLREEIAMNDNITLPREVAEQLLKTLKNSAHWSRLYYGSREVGDAIQDLEFALAAEQPKPEPLKPHGYAYRYRDGIRFNGGNTVNGELPREVLPYWFAPPDTEALRRENERLREALAKCVDAARDCALQHRIAADSMYDQAEAALRREET